VCLIVDANYAHRVYPQPDPDGLPVHDALRDGSAQLFYGGSQMVAEYLLLSRKFRRWLYLLYQKGTARRVDDAAVDGIANQLRSSQACASDDQHIIAVARVSSARLLCSSDQLLHADFTNPTLLTPQGSVYQTAAHASLIREHCEQAVTGTRAKRPTRAQRRRGAMRKRRGR